MTLDPLYGLHPSSEARCVFACLHRRGGSMRLGPLLDSLGMDRRVVLDAVNELCERYWITIVWRKATPGPEPGIEPGLADEGARPLTDIHRLCSTRFGRRKYRSTWPAY